MNERYCLAIDPGTEQSAYLVIDRDFHIEHYDIQDNRYILEVLPRWPDARIVCEEIESFGMPVGRETFRTVRWIGRFEQAAFMQQIPFELVSRKTIKSYWCGTTRATDSNVWQAMVDLWGPPGTKKAQGKLYGIKSHERSALAIAAWKLDVLQSGTNIAR